MSTHALTLRHWFRPRPAVAGSTLRLEVCPPSLRQLPPSPWRRVLFWLLAPAPGDAGPAVGRLQAVRQDFHASVADLTVVPDAGELVGRIEHARTLRELWHLRAEVFRVVALQFSQTEAEQRLAALNRHFPTRSPRSAFMPL